MVSPAWCRAVSDKLDLLRSLEQLLDRPGSAPRTALSEAEVSRFEAQHGIELPAEYREFVLHVGDGGVGPAYGIEPLGGWAPDALPQVTATVTTAGGESVSAGTGERPPLSRPSEPGKPFLLQEPWSPVDEEGRPRPLPIPEGANPYDGCLRLGEIGCGYFYFLVVTGAARGAIWSDYTAGDGALGPEAPGFRAWIEEWVAAQLAGALADVAREVLAGRARAPMLELLARGAAHLDPMATKASQLAAACLVRLGLGERDRALAALEAIAATEPDSRWLPELRGHVWSREIEMAGSSAASDLGIALARHPALEVRVALAGNPKASPSALEHLTADDSPEVRRRAMANPRVDAGLLAALVDGCITAREDGGVEPLIDLELAIRHPAATSELVRRAAAWAESWDDDRAAAVVLRGAALAPACDETLRRRLARSAWPEVRHGVARSSATAVAELVALAADPDPAVRAAVALRRDLPPEQLAELAADPDPAVRGASGRNPHTPAGMLRALIGDLTYDISYALSCNPNLPPEVATLLPLHPYSVDDRSIDPSDVPWPEDGDGPRSDAPAAEVVAAVEVAHPSFPVVLLPGYYDEYIPGRGRLTGAYCMSSRPWLAHEQMVRVARDDYGSARLNVARRADLPAALAEELAEDRWEDVRAAIVAHQRVSAEMWTRLVDDPSDRVLERVAAHPEIPDEVLERLSGHPNEYVRRGAAQNPRAPTAFVERLAADSSHQPRWWAVLHPAVSRATIERLTRDPNSKVRAAAAFRLGVAGLVATA